MEPARLSPRRALVAVGATLALLTAPASGQEPARRPNVVFILADDLGYGDLGCYGQERIRTPRLDRLAAEGRRFTAAYAGSTVCAPSRCCLMTGFHTGHARVRGNALVPLEPDDVTVAEVLKGAGYATALVGKWGLGEPDSTGVPNRQGFDSFFGYLNQRHAHNAYPDYLWRDQEREEIPGNRIGDEDGVSVETGTYSQALFTDEAIGFLREHKEGPFFLYLSYTLPHANNERGRGGRNGMEVPSDAPYSDETWPQPQKNHAAMISWLDRDVGRVLDTLDELGLADDTMVIFTSDNGPHREGGAKPDFFDSSGPLRGIKRDLYEGGIRVPMIARWPGQIPAGTTSDHPIAFWDMLPTLAHLAGAEAPEGLDGLDMTAALTGQGTPPSHPYLYWEFHEGGFLQAARHGDWKAVRRGLNGPIELYDLATDLGEQHNIAADHPEVVAEFDAYFRRARTDSADFPVKPGPKVRVGAR